MRKIEMKKILVTLFILLTSCSADKFNDYIGYWHINDSDGELVVQIKKDGDTVLFVENILGNRPNEVVIGEIEDQLIAKGRVLSLTDSGQTLGYGNKRFVKLSGAEFDVIKEEQQRKYEELRVAAEKAELKRQENRAACVDLKAQHEKDSALITKNFGADYQGRNKALREQREKFNVAAAKIPDCIRTSLF